MWSMHYVIVRKHTVHMYMYMHTSHIMVCSTRQLDAYDLLSKEPSTVIMAENQCKELLGGHTIHDTNIFAGLNFHTYSMYMYMYSMNHLVFKSCKPSMLMCKKKSHGGQPSQ